MSFVYLFRIRLLHHDSASPGAAVSASAARKLLLGKVPRSDAKAAVYTALRAAGAPIETFDEGDAMPSRWFRIT